MTDSLMLSIFYIKFEITSLTFPLSPAPQLSLTFCYLCLNLSGKASEPFSYAGCKGNRITALFFNTEHRTSWKGKIK